MNKSRDHAFSVTTKPYFETLEYFLNTLDNDQQAILQNLDNADAANNEVTKAQINDHRLKCEVCNTKVAKLKCSYCGKYVCATCGGVFDKQRKCC
jgi:hypothetical protein